MSGDDEAGEGRGDLGSGGGRGRPRLGRNIIALALVSLLTDVSSEMIYPLLPIFLGTVIGASPAFIGVIEGAAESTAALLKLASGWWSDRVRQRKPLVVAGYLLATVARPLVGLASSAAQVLAIRLTDRVGKGIRTSPRDALIADSVPLALRGRAFGFHRAADHLGAVLGPVVAFAMLQWVGVSLRSLFLWAAVPGALAVLVLIVRVREAPRGAADGSGGDTEGAAEGAAARAPIAGAPPQLHDAPAAAASPHQKSAPRAETTPDAGGPPGPERRFAAYLAAVLLFTLGNSTDAFLLLRAAQLGVPASLVPLLWAMLHVVKSAASAPGGALSDRLGRRPLIVAGWLLYALVYLGFAAAGSAWHAWALFAVYGVHFGLAEGAERALVADLVSARRRGAAFGWYNLAVGAGALPASLLFGVVWERYGAPAAFAMGAAFAVAASAVLATLVAERSRPT